MSTKQFEDFIVSKFIEWAPSQVIPGERLQFKSPSEEVRKNIYGAFTSLPEGETISYRDINLTYITIGDIKLLPLLHLENSEGLNEHFLAHLRDEPESPASPLYGTVLLFIHNSTLDTIINSSNDLAYKENVWSPSSIKESLESLINEQADNKEMSQCLLDYQFSVIQEDGATMFGFEKLYHALLDGELHFNELGLFPDPLVTELAGKPEQIRKRLDENRKLYQSIEKTVSMFSGDLGNRLKEFGSKFISQKFPKGGLDSWKEVDFGVYLAEKETNSRPTLVFDRLSSESCKLVSRSNGDSRTAQRNQNIIIQVPELGESFDFMATFDGKDLQSNQVKVVNKKAMPMPDGSVIKVTSGSKQCRVRVQGPFDGVPLYFKIDTSGRNKSTEKFSFDCLVIREGDFEVDAFASKFTISSGKSLINLHTDEYNLVINSDATEVRVLQRVGETIDMRTTHEVDFKDLANMSDVVAFKVRNGDHELHFNIEGAVATESLSLPLIFDKSRFSRLFRDDYFGEFIPKKNKVIIDNSEVTQVGVRVSLLRLEGDFISERLIALDDREGVPLSLLSDQCPPIYEAYTKLYEYLEQYRTLPSLVSWGEEYRGLVRDVVDAYLNYLERISIDSVLSNTSKLVLKIGMVRKENEYFSPYHPLVLAYYLSVVEEMIKDSDNASFKYLPQVTVDRLTPRGLIPFLYDEKHKFSYVQQVKENASWLSAVPHEENNYSYVRKVINEKIGEFQKAFSQLFVHGERSKLLISAVNQRSCEELLMGIVDHFGELLKRDLDSACHVHVNLYDERFQFNWFDDFAEMTNHNKLKEKLGLDKGKYKAIADTLIDLLRTRLTYSKFTHEEASISGYAYAHLTFFRNEKKIQPVPVNIDASFSGVAAGGLLSGEASESKGGSYYTAFGLKGINYKNIPFLRIAKVYGSLIRPARESNAQYTGANALALAVDDGFKGLLQSSYESSIWTTIIDPKVTLDFFSNQNLTLIHFSDQYTTSAGYDAITVASDKKLYRSVLEQGEGGRIEEFNAFNGECLLKMLTANETARRGIEGEVGAYKFVTSMVSSSGITWVPLSVGEMVRVSGNIGLRIMDSEFAPGAHGNSKGPMSDDILLVGFKDQELFLLPVEVKTGVYQGYDKAVLQVKSLRSHLTFMLGRRTFANKIYRALFFRQVLIQVDKYRLYEVFDNGYFDDLLASREEWLRGEYELAQLEDYPKGVVVAHVDSASVFAPDYKEIDEVLCIELPISLLPKLVSTPLKELMADDSIQSLCNVPQEYILAVDTDTQVVEPEIEPEIGSGKHLSVLMGYDSANKKPVLWEPTDTSKVFNTNTGIIGTMGTGKTQFTKSLITQLVRNQRDNVGGTPIGILIFDYKADYVKEDFVQATNATVYDLHNLPFNPFALVGDKPMLPVHTAGQFRATISKAFGLGAKQGQRVHELVMQAYAKSGITIAKSTWANKEPTMNTIWDLFLDQEKVEQDSLYAALYELTTFQVFESNHAKTKSLYDTLDGVTVINLSGYDPKIQNLVVAITLDIFYAQMHQHGSSKIKGDHRQITKMILVDEADNFMAEDFESLKKILKEGREFGVGTILSTQELTHFKTGGSNYANYILSWVIHRVSQLKSQDIKAIFNSKDKHDEERYMQSIRQLDKHYSLYINGQKEVVKMKDMAFWELEDKYIFKSSDTGGGQ